MGKKKRKKKVTTEKSSMPFWQKLSKTQQWIGATILLFLVLAIYFAPLLIDGLSPTGADVVGGIGKVHQIKEFQKETGERALWNPYVFSGMPLYHRLSSNDFALDKIISIFYNTSGRSGFVYYVIGALGMFFLTQFWRIPIWGSILASLAFVFMPHYEVLLQAGHYQKFRPIMMMPWVVLCFTYFLRRANLWSVAFFIVAFSTQVRTKHYQIIFYTMLILSFFGIAYIIQNIKRKDYAAILKRIGLFIGAVIFSLFMSIQAIWPVRDYTPYSIRGGTGEKGSTGLDYDYATGWSLSPKEMLSLLIPNAFGGSSRITYRGNAVPRLQGRDIPGYWGDMPFYEGGDYVGIITFIFAIIGLIAGWRQKKRIVMTLSLFIVFAFLLSFGRHFPLLYTFFFKFVPVFNKFRAPSMILTAIYFSFACLAGFGFKTIVDMPSENRKKLIKTISGLAVFLVFLALVPYLFKPLFAFEKAGEAGRYTPEVFQMIKDARYDLMKRDAMRLLVFALLGCGLLFVYLKEWIKKSIMSILLGAFLLIDLITINNRFLNNLGSIDQLERSYFAQTETDRFLLEDQTLFRIFPVEQNVFTNNNWSYYHQSVGGYSPAKLRIYQDIIESCFYRGWDTKLPINWNIINMLNTKYLIVPGEISHSDLELVHTDGTKKYFTYKNNMMLPRAYFVGNYEIIAEKADRFKRLNDPQFDPANSAILEKEPNFHIEKPVDSEARVTLYQPNRIQLDVRTDKSTLLVLSEIYYPHGWKATIDGAETEILRTNHILRSIYVPAGNHRITFEFAPKSFIISARISGISNALVYLALVVLGIVRIVQKRRKA